MVEPKFYSNPEGTGDPLYQHRYRYDVIGHLRFGKHKRGDGSYSHTIEWVAPHQRGLQHSMYIPKTHRVEGGKTIAPEMRRYWNVEVSNEATEAT
jgi:hypothetical protein